MNSEKYYFLNHTLNYFDFQNVLDDLFEGFNNLEEDKKFIGDYNKIVYQVQEFKKNYPQIFKEKTK